MMRILVDTSTWLDLARRRNGQRWIVALRVLVHQGDVELMVPPLIVDEFDRNRERVEAAMTSSVASRFKALRQDLLLYADDDEQSMRVIDDLSRHVPLVGAMTLRNFTDIRELLVGARTIVPSDRAERRVIERGLQKSAPFHRGRNSVADALLIEAYADEALDTQEPDVYAFVTSNSDDFSLATGDKRLPHDDISMVFDGVRSIFALGVDGLDAVMRGYFGDEAEELFNEVDFREEPRRLDEILAAETEMFDRIWYHRSLQHDYRLEKARDDQALAEHRRVADSGRRRVEATYTALGQLGPYTDFELGMLHGKMSALRWVLGSEWDFLDT
ncbi:MULTISPECIES: PIN domain-containing protein [unclassified Microbacterium]|uniref:PIN domain-containing protein n=1 Tax=unclassified Microbacterium TaxID=2609290 RepID=UPI003C2D98CA